MQSYVLGFCFNYDYTCVVLIRKARPEWQAGKLNGVGGHVEEGETPIRAMDREFREETSWEGSVEWTAFGRLSGPGWEVHLFHSRYQSTLGSCAGPLYEAEGERASVHSVHVVLEQPSSKGSPPLPNLRWIIPMALGHATGAERARYFDVRECDTPG